MPISFIGLTPFIKYNPLGGSEFLVTQILAEKFGFLPKFVPERAFDVTTANGTTFGMVHRVRLMQMTLKIRGKLTCLTHRYPPNKQNLESDK